MRKQNLFSKELCIEEKAVGSNDPKIIKLLENMVKLYMNMGKDEEVKRLEEKIRIRSKK